MQLGKRLKDNYSNTNIDRACRLKRGGHLKIGKILKDVYLNTWIGIWIGVLIFILFYSITQSSVTLLWSSISFLF